MGRLSDAVARSFSAVAIVASRELFAAQRWCNALARDIAMRRRLALMVRHRDFASWNAA